MMSSGIWFRRRLSAEGAKPESNNRWKSDLGHVCMYVCMVIDLCTRHLMFEVRNIASSGVPGYVQNFSPIGPVVSELQKRGAHVRTCGSTPSLGCALASAVWYLSIYQLWAQSAQPFWRYWHSPLTSFKNTSHAPRAGPPTPHPIAPTHVSHKFYWMDLSNSEERVIIGARSDEIWCFTFRAAMVMPTFLR